MDACLTAKAVSKLTILVLVEHLAVGILEILRIKHFQGFSKFYGNVQSF